MSFGSILRHELLITVAAAVATVFAGCVLLRGVLLAERLGARDALLEAASLWLALNLVPVGLAVTGPGLFEVFPGVLKSFLWMTILVVAMCAGAEVGTRGSANRLLGIVGAVFGLVLGSVLLLAPSGALLACPADACFKPLVGYSVTLLDSIEREDIVVHVPAVPGTDDRQ